MVPVRIYFRIPLMDHFEEFHFFAILIELGQLFVQSISSWSLVFLLLVIYCFFQGIISLPCIKNESFQFDYFFKYIFASVDLFNRPVNFSFALFFDHSNYGRFCHFCVHAMPSLVQIWNCVNCVYDSSKTTALLTDLFDLGVVKESYIYVTGRGLIYMSVSEARLCCFKHHLDDQPLFQIALTEVMNFNGRYLDI